MDYILELISGPGNLRFVVQPLIAIVLAIRDGRNDAKAGTPPYLYELVFGSGRRATDANQAGRDIRRKINRSMYPIPALRPQSLC